MILQRCTVHVDTEDQGMNYTQPSERNGSETARAGAFVKWSPNARGSKGFYRLISETRGIDK